MTTMTTTAMGAGGLPGGSEWRTESSGGWCRLLAVGLGPH